jgi:hypothetical protein
MQVIKNLNSFNHEEVNVTDPFEYLYILQLLG